MHLLSLVMSQIIISMTKMDSHPHHHTLPPKVTQRLLAVLCMLSPAGKLLQYPWSANLETFIVYLVQTTQLMKGCTLMVRSLPSDNQAINQRQSLHPSPGRSCSTNLLLSLVSHAAPVSCLLTNSPGSSRPGQRHLYPTRTHCCWLLLRRYEQLL